jgi:hypothetical protein
MSWYLVNLSHLPTSEPICSGVQERELYEGAILEDPSLPETSEDVKVNTKKVLPENTPASEKEQ